MTETLPRTGVGSARRLRGPAPFRPPARCRAQARAAQRPDSAQGSRTAAFLRPASTQVSGLKEGKRPGGGPRRPGKDRAAAQVKAVHEGQGAGAGTPPPHRAPGSCPQMGKEARGGQGHALSPRAFQLTGQEPGREPSRLPPPASHPRPSAHPNSPEAGTAGQ